jgi:hypothetical protein
LVDEGWRFWRRTLIRRKGRGTCAARIGVAHRRPAAWQCFVVGSGPKRTGGGRVIKSAKGVTLHSLQQRGDERKKGGLGGLRIEKFPRASWTGMEDNKTTFNRQER